MERPFDQLRDMFRESNSQDKEMFKYIFEKSDGLSLWIIGLAVGAISIFVNNIGDIKTAVNVIYLKPILYLLAVSVATGIIYRTLYLYFFMLHNQMLRGIDISLSRQSMMDTESFLKGDETFNQLIRALSEGFGEDFSHLLDEYEQQPDPIKKKMLYDSLVDHYNKSVEFARQDIENAIGFVADTYAKFFGVSKAKLSKKMHGGSGATQYKIVAWTATLFYVTYLISFIAALFLFIQGV